MARCSDKFPECESCINKEMDPFQCETCENGCNFEGEDDGEELSRVEFYDLFRQAA